MSVLGRERRDRRRNHYGTTRAGRRWRGGYSERRRGGRGATGSSGLETLARLGFLARGIVYIVIGVIGVMMAAGVAQHEPDRAGALEAIATKPLGYLLLWILVIGFAGLAVWRLVQAATARLNSSAGQRLYVLGLGIAYAIVFFSTLMFVLHGRTPASSNTAPRDLTARMLSWSGGWVLVTLIGIVIVAVGIALVLRGLRIEFIDDLRMGWMKASTRDLVVWLGRIGYVARGLVVVGIGVAAFDAGATYNPADAKGVDGVLREFARTAIGPWLLILVSLGLIAFGLLSFLEAKWRRTYGGIPV